MVSIITRKKDQVINKGRPINLIDYYSIEIFKDKVSR